MRKLFVAALSLVIASTITGCDSDSPTSSNANLTAPLTGRVILTQDCDTLSDHSGVLVRTQLGATAVTNKEGYFTIQVPLWQWNLSLTKDGFHDDDYGDYSWIQDSGKFVPRAPNLMYAHTRYSGKFVGEPEVRWETVIEHRYAQVDSSGVLVTKLVRDTIDVRIYTIATLPLDPDGQPTTFARSVLLISQDPQIDPTNRASYAYYIDEHPGDKHVFTFEERTLRSAGIDPDKTFYVGITTLGPCRGYRETAVKAFEIKRIDP